MYKTNSVRWGMKFVSRNKVEGQQQRSIEIATYQSIGRKL